MPDIFIIWEMHSANALIPEDDEARPLAVGNELMDFT
jgi:hypothetical protein